MKNGGIECRNSSDTSAVGYSYNGILIQHNNVTHRLFGLGSTGIVMGYSSRPIADINTSKINGYTPITSGNISDYLADLESRISALESKGE